MKLLEFEEETIGSVDGHFTNLFIATEPIREFIYKVILSLECTNFCRVFLIMAT